MPADNVGAIGRIYNILIYELTLTR